MSVSKLQRQVARCVKSIGEPDFYAMFANIVDNPDFADLIQEGKIRLPGVAGCEALVAHLNALITNYDSQIINIVASVKGIANITPNFIITHSCGATNAYFTYACGKRCCWYHGENPFHGIIENIVAQYAQTDAARKFIVDKFNSTRLFAQNDYLNQEIQTPHPIGYFHFKTHVGTPNVDLFVVGESVPAEPTTDAETMITEMSKMIRGMTDAEEIVMTVLLMKKDPRYADINALSADEFAKLLKQINENTKQIYENNRIRVIDRELKCLTNYYENVEKYGSNPNVAHTEEFAHNYNLPLIEFPTLDESRDIHVIKNKPKFEKIVKQIKQDKQDKLENKRTKKGVSIFDLNKKPKEEITSPRFAEIVKRNAQA